MTNCKILTEKTADQLVSTINVYLRAGWTLINCFYVDDRVYAYKAVIVK